MRYKLNSRTRYSECDTSRRLSVGSLVDYLQDCATFHSEDSGLGSRAMKEQGMAWVLISWNIETQRMPLLGENIEVSTWAYCFKGFFGYRNFLVCSDKGEILSKGDSLWLLYDLEHGKPVRVPKEFDNAYGVEDKLEMGYEDRKIPLPEGFDERSEPTGRVTVSRYHLDSNGHVNNGQYVKMMEQFLPDEKDISRIRVEYRKQAHLGDELEIRVADTDGCYYAVIGNSTGEECVRAVFDRK